MYVGKDETDDTELNRIQVHNRIQFDGRLVAPIDLTLECAKTIKLEPLSWIHLEDQPMKMKITNTGETVILSGKWGTQRPYITGGPLVGNYVFSQIHFHWGQNVHEGSEHTVRGVAYPMEMHVVMFKSRYLTQEAALKHEDGVIIINYLIKLADKSSSSLQWLANNLEKIAQPKTHLMLDPAPLSSILVPMTRDYLMYWGALVTDHCSHTIMWIISRAALAITAEDLNKFRQLQNLRSELMTKNFREATHHQGRMIFHVNPRAECNNLLLPGTIAPPGRPLVVNYTHVPELDPRLAESVFKSGVGDCNEKINNKLNDNKKSKSNSFEKPVKIRASHQNRSLSPNKTVEQESSKREKKITPDDHQQCQKLGGRAEKVERKHNKFTRPKSFKKENSVNICLKPKKILQSSLAQYFEKRPGSAASEKPVQKVINRPFTPRPKAGISYIPRPIGMNAGKINANKIGNQS